MIKQNCTFNVVHQFDRILKGVAQNADHKFVPAARVRPCILKNPVRCKRMRFQTSAACPSAFPPTSRTARPVSPTNNAVKYCSNALQYYQTNNASEI